MSAIKSDTLKEESNSIYDVKNERLVIRDRLTYISEEEEMEAIRSGLTQEQKQLSSKYFYNTKGSLLFEEICRLPEYYQTRTEIDILKKKVVPSLPEYEFVELVELGSGENRKISIFLNALTGEKNQHIRYVPVDVSESAIRKSSEELIAGYPNLTVQAVLADFTRPVDFNLNGYPHLFCFFGSTIGNLPQKEAVELLRNIAGNMNYRDRLLVGFDRKKPLEILELAYNDSKGVTAAFNKNILQVINDYAEGNFNPNDFGHVAFYNADKSRIEMHLRATYNMNIHLKKANLKIAIRKGETLHTENSRKYEINDFHTYAMKAGLKVNKIYSDENEWFSIVEFISR